MSGSSRCISAIAAMMAFAQRSAAKGPFAVMRLPACSTSASATRTRASLSSASASGLRHTAVSLSARSPARASTTGAKQIAPTIFPALLASRTRACRREWDHKWSRAPSPPTRSTASNRPTLTRSQTALRPETPQGLSPSEPSCPRVSWECLYRKLPLPQRQQRQHPHEMEGKDPQKPRM